MTEANSVVNRYMPVVILGLLVLLGISLLVSANGVVLNVWMDRDLARAADYHFLTTVQGPESGAGFRSPGGGFYALLAAVFAVVPDIISAALLQAAMLGIACLLLAGAVYRLSGSWFQAMATATVYATSGAFRDFQTFWNPGFIPLFTVFLTVLLYQAAITRKAGYICWFLLVLSFSMQIHQQVLLFLPVALLICVVWRPVWNRWSVMLAVAAFVLPIAPYILQQAGSSSVMTFGADRSVWDTPYVSSPALSLDWMADRLGVLLALGGDNAASVDGLFGGTAGALLYQAFRLHDFLLIVFLIGGGALVVRHRRLFTKQAAERHPDRILLALTLSLILVAILVLAAGTVVTDRHIVFAAPGFAILAGWVAAGLVKMISRDRLREAVITLLYLAMALKILFFALLGFTGSGIDPARYAGARMIHDYITGRLGWSYEMASDRLAVFNGGTGKLVSERLPFGAFFLLPSSVTAEGDGYAGCLVAVSKGSSGKLTQAGLTEQLTGHPHLKLLMPVITGMDETDAFYFVRYRGREGNCLKAATNAYLYQDPSQVSGQNEDLPQYLTGQGASATVWRAVGDATRPIPLWLGLVSGPDGLHPVLDGRELRGHTGFKTRKLEQPYVEFRDGSGNVTGLSASQIPFVGGRYNDIGTMATWHLPTITLPAGRYSLTLGFAEEGATRRISLGDLEITGKPGSSGIQWQN